MPLSVLKDEDINLSPYSLFDWNNGTGMPVPYTYLHLQFFVFQFKIQHVKFKIIFLKICEICGYSFVFMINFELPRQQINER